MALFKTLPTVLRSFLLPLTLTVSTMAYSDIALPTIGDASSSIVSMQKERENWWRLFKNAKQPVKHRVRP